MVEGPNYLNRQQYCQQGKRRAAFESGRNFIFWAEPVTNGVRRVIAELLTKPLLADGITVFCLRGSSNGGDYVLLLDIHSGWTATFDAKAVLECHWSLLDKNEKALGSVHLFFGRNGRGANYHALVDA